jgi:predicted  nucleic acid-binding Zn-ribbon protein|tara:strand:+ start:691 stop:849 length:159 start_codon:yes stop_codon:yes gene_type:complete
MIHIDDHLDERQELEQERDYWQEQAAKIQKELDEVKQELEGIKKIYFKDGHF